jgi:peptidoglycan hydrolase-like protein with peptidoglycan-binding domain
VSPPPTMTPVFHFSRGLQLAMRGEDVRQLQIYLNTHGFTVAPSGAGSPGHETDFFGPATNAALAKFQRANGIMTDTGYFGPRTRALIR